jgi:hypothetical protein
MHYPYHLRRPDLRVLWHHATTRLKQWTTSEVVRRYSANTGWLMLSRFAWIITALVVGIYVVRQLGPYRFGQLNDATALTGVTLLFLDTTTEVDGSASSSPADTSATYCRGVPSIFNPPSNQSTSPCQWNWALCF